MQFPPRLSTLSSSLSLPLLQYNAPDSARDSRSVFCGENSAAESQGEYKLVWLGWGNCARPDFFDVYAKFFRAVSLDKTAARALDSLRLYFDTRYYTTLKRDAQQRPGNY